MALTTKAAAGLAGLMALGAALAGCGGGSGSDGGTTITVWHGYTDVEAKAMTAQAKQWNADHPDEKVKLVYNGGNDNALQKTVAGFTAGNYPDVAYQFGSSAAQLARQPKLVDLTDTVKKADFNWDDFYPSEQQAATVNGKVVGVPALVDNLSLVYNKSMFKAAGVPLPTASLDLGRLPQRREEADRPRDEDLRLGLRQRRQRGHRLALPRRCSGRPAATCSTATTPSPRSTPPPARRRSSCCRTWRSPTSRSTSTTATATTSTSSTAARSRCSGPARGTCPASTPTSTTASPCCPGYDGNHETISGPDLYMAFDHSKGRVRRRR